MLTHVGGVGDTPKIRAMLCSSPQRPDRFAEAILRLLDDTALRERLIKAGLETIAAVCHKARRPGNAGVFQEPL